MAVISTTSSTMMTAPPEPLTKGKRRSVTISTCYSCRGTRRLYIIHSTSKGGIQHLACLRCISNISYLAKSEGKKPTCPLCRELFTTELLPSLPKPRVKLPLSCSTPVRVLAATRKILATQRALLSTTASCEDATSEATASSTSSRYDFSTLAGTDFASGY